MGLFDKLKRNRDQSKLQKYIATPDAKTDIYIDFSKWLDKHLSKNLPDDIIAVNFNLYEGSNQTYDVQFVGCNRFDEEDDDWVCDEVYTTEEDVFFIPRPRDIAEWKQGLEFITELTEKYLREGKYMDKLKSYTAVCIGFVDGDIDVLYRTK